MLSRQRGFTVTTCVVGMADSQEGAQIIGLTPSQKVKVETSAHSPARLSVSHLFTHVSLPFYSPLLCGVCHYPPVSPAGCLPLTRRQSGIPEKVLCREAEDTELGPACRSSCTAGCTDALERYKAESERRSGFVVGADEARRMLRQCSRECTYDCSKPGKQYDFEVPFKQ